MMKASMQTSLARVKGLGSARHGVHHWWMQRLTSIALIPLVLYAVVGLVFYAGADYATARGWLAQPVNACAVLLLFGVGLFHASLGVQTVIEDYISHETLRILLLAGVKLGLFALATLALFSILAVALG